MTDGRFLEATVFQVSDQDIIIAIKDLLRLTDPVMKLYDYEYLEKEYKDNMALLETLSKDYEKRKNYGELQKNMTELRRQIANLEKYKDDY
jgi:predicted glycosyl hydrolase (DUF1957 family)